MNPNEMIPIPLIHSASRRRFSRPTAEAPAWAKLAWLLFCAACLFLIAWMMLP